MALSSLALGGGDPLDGADANLKGAGDLELARSLGEHLANLALRLVVVRFIMACDAARTLSLMIVRSADYRPRSVGSHYKTFVALEAADPAFAELSAYFDGCRIKRNASEYDFAGVLLRFHYRGNVTVMAIAQSKVTAQGQISVPAEVRRKLGVGPGSVLEWDEQGSEVVVRRAGRHSSKDIYLALFPAKTPKKDLPDVKDGVRKYIRKRHARG